MVQDAIYALVFVLLYCRINNEWSFDDGIAKYGCRVYAFDPSMRKKDHFRSPKIQFFNTGLADVDSERAPGASGKKAWKTRTLKTIITELGHHNVSKDRSLPYLHPNFTITLTVLFFYIFTFFFPVDRQKLCKKAANPQAF